MGRRVLVRVGADRPDEDVVSVGPADAVLGPGEPVGVGEAAELGRGAAAEAAGILSQAVGEAGVGAIAAAVRGEQVEDRPADHGRVQRGAGDDLAAAADHAVDHVHLCTRCGAEQSADYPNGVGHHHDFFRRATAAQRAAAISTGADTSPHFHVYQEQIGLKLNTTKAPAKVLVIDNVSKPSEDQKGGPREGICRRAGFLHGLR